MRFTISARRAVVVCTALSMLAGCGGGNNGLSSSTPMSVAPLFRPTPHTSQGHLYVGVFGGGSQGGGGPADVVVYPLGSTNVAYTIKKGISEHIVGVVVDPSGNLYVGVGGGSSSCSSCSSVVVYAPGQKKPSYTITLPYSMNYNPFAFDSSGNLYVLNSPQVSVYAPGTTTPLRTYHAGGFPGQPAMALDGSNDLYLVESPGHSNPPFDVSINVYAPESTSLLYTIKALKRTCWLGSGSPALAAAPNGTLYAEYYCSASNTNNVLVFAPGKKKPSYALKPPATGSCVGSLNSLFFYSGNLYVSMGIGDIAVYALGKRKPTYNTTFCGGGGGITDITFDTSGNIYESDYFGAVVFAPGQQQPSYDITGLQVTDSVAVGP
jgi:hypothetical protein